MNQNLSHLSDIDQPRPQTTVITEILEKTFGVPEWRPHLDPLEELVACILSQHTSDINSFRAFDRLRERFADWEAVRKAPVSDLADAIRCGGLADSKAPRIQKVLDLLQEKHGTITLNFLEEMTDEEARGYLLSFPGVGPKTAAIVLCFGMGRNVLAVDTHVFRVAWRLGLIEKKIGEAKAHDALQKQLEEGMAYRFHIALITHGRRTCKAITPQCGVCPLTERCRYYKEVILPVKAPPMEES